MVSLQDLECKLYEISMNISPVSKKSDLIAVNVTHRILVPHHAPRLARQVRRV